MKSIFRMFSAVLLLVLGIGANAADGPQLVMEEFMVPAVDPGISLYVRNKHPQGVRTFPGEKILLYVHGATYPSETAFDLKLNGLSWMDYIAACSSSRQFSSSSMKGSSRTSDGHQSA